MQSLLVGGCWRYWFVRMRFYLCCPSSGAQLAEIGFNDAFPLKSDRAIVFSIDFGERNDTDKRKAWSLFGKQTNSGWNPPIPTNRTPNLQIRSAFLSKSLKPLALLNNGRVSRERCTSPVVKIISEPRNLSISNTKVWVANCSEPEDQTESWTFPGSPSKYHTIFRERTVSVSLWLWFRSDSVPGCVKSKRTPHIERSHWQVGPNENSAT